MADTKLWIGDELKNTPVPMDKIAKADPMDRLLAYLIDAVIMTVGFILCLLPGIVYFLLRDSLYDGRSIGKKMMGLQVLNSVNKTPCKLMESVIRNVSLAIPVFGIVDGIMVFIDENNQRFGDKWAETEVIKSVE
jgi:uncharacterized RDD family membrane protein YckC